MQHSKVNYIQQCRSLHVFNGCFNYTDTTPMCPEDSGKILLTQVVLLQEMTNLVCNLFCQYIMLCS